MATSNRDRVGAALELLGTVLDPFIQRVVAPKLPEGTDWTLLLSAKDSSKGIAKEYNRDDVYQQLRALTEKLVDGWFPFDDHLSRAEKNLAGELRDVRNRWAHTQSFSGDDTYRALDTVERLLRAVDATTQADEVRVSRQALQREQYESEVKRTARSQTALPTLESTGLPPWREVLRPHPDIESGDYAASEFAADLYLVAQQKAEREYTDPVEFFRRTYLTEGLQDLLTRAAARVTGDANATPVINLQTNFGGGKTHSMLAVWHLFSGRPIADYPQEVQDAVAGHDLGALGTVNRVAIVGNEISAGQPVVKDDGTEVHTLWGELAWQLGEREGYELVAQADRTATSPGALDELLTRFGPAVILIDEWVSYARQLHSRDELCGGTFDTQFTFAQALTEAAKRVPGTLLLVSIPSSDVRRDADGESHDASDLEIGGVHGREALQRLQNVVGRLAQQWRPASSQESFEIVRRRLFLEPGPDARTQIGVTAKKLREFYQQHRGEFPRETGELGYENRIKQAYPIHPELFDRLYEDWSSLERFQRTRGVLRLMSGVVHELWNAGDQSPLIMPGSVPLDTLGVRDEIAAYLEDSWKPIIDADIDGEGSTPRRIDAERPLFGKRSLTRRIARSVFLGSAPRLHTAHKGIERQRVFLGVAQPGDTVGNFGSALQMLGDRATYFYADGDSYWFDLQQSLSRVARDYAEGFHDEDVWAEIITRLKSEQNRPGEFASVVVAPDSSTEVADTDAVRLVLLHPRFRHSRGSDESSAHAFVTDLIANRGSAPRERRNTMVALAPDNQRVEELISAVRSHLAWRQIVKRTDEMNLTQQQAAQARRRNDDSGRAVDQRIPTTYIWALYPDQPDGGRPFRIATQKIEGSDSHLAARTGKKLVAEDVLRTRTSARNIRMDLDKHLRSRWNDGRIPFGELWDYYAKYPYLPRLRDRRVLDEAVRDVLATVDIAWPSTGFALAQGYDSRSGDFDGLALPTEDDSFGPLTDATLLVAPSLAQAQRAREHDEAEQDPGDPEASGGAHPPAGTDGPAPRKTAGGGAAPDQTAPATANARYEGRVTVEPTGDIESQLSTIAREVLIHLQRHGPDALDITLEVSAERLDGFPESAVRTVSENGRTLGFAQNKFEDGQ
jgi:predicted AAA+ superfamily ATPase